MLANKIRFAFKQELLHNIYSGSSLSLKKKITWGALWHEHIENIGGAQETLTKSILKLPGCSR